MAKIQLSDKKYDIVINNEVLEKFEDEAKHNAFQFDQRNLKQLSKMTYLAIKEAGGDVEESFVKSHVNLTVAVPIVEEYFKAVLGPDAGDKLDDALTEKK